MNATKKGCPTDVEEGKKYKLKKKQRNGMLYAIYWELGFGMAHVFRILKISPNMVSTLACILYFIMAYFLFHGAFILGGVLFFVAILLDCTDGKLARMTGRTSELGVWLDYNFDNVRALFLYPPIAYALYMSGYDMSIFLWAFIAMEAHLLNTIVNLKWADYDFTKKAKENYVKKSKLHIVLKQFYFVEGFEPLVLILAALLGHVEWYLMLWAVGLSAMYLALALFGGKAIYKHDKK